MDLKQSILLLVIFVLGKLVDDTYGKDAVELVTNSFDRNVAIMPHFVLFCVPW